MSFLAITKHVLSNITNMGLEFELWLIASMFIFIYVRNE